MALAFAAGAFIGSGGAIAGLHSDAGASVVEAVLEMARGVYR
jgi:hypothetical protein